MIKFLLDEVAFIMVKPNVESVQSSYPKFHSKCFGRKSLQRLHYWLEKVKAEKGFSRQEEQDNCSCSMSLCACTAFHAVMSFSGGSKWGYIVYSPVGPSHVAIDGIVLADKCLLVLRTYLLARLLIKQKINLDIYIINVWSVRILKSNYWLWNICNDY